MLIEVGNTETYICSMAKHFLIEDVENWDIDLGGF
jgi:hypothetical protein